MNRLIGIYSEYGLKEGIEFRKNKIAEKEKEYQEVEIRYNPLCAENNRREIADDIRILKEELNDYEEALGAKQQLSAAIESKNLKKVELVNEYPHFPRGLKFFVVGENNFLNRKKYILQKEDTGGTIIVSEKELREEFIVCE